MKLSTYSSLAVILAVAIAAIGWLGLAGWIAVAVFVASVGMHVAGNAIGTRLREETDRGLAASRRGRSVAFSMPAIPQSRLQKSESLGRTLPVSAVIGAAFGGTIGAASLAWFVKSSAAGAMLGGLSSAVIGGLLGFLLASFVEIIRTAVSEAIRAEQETAQRTADARNDVASNAKSDLVRYEVWKSPPEGEPRP